MQTPTHFRLVGLLCVMLVSAPSILWGQSGGSPWERYNQAGMEAYQQGKYPEAEKQFKAALQEAKKFGPEDPRLATSHNNLAELYRTQGKYAKAEPLYKRSVAINEKALGREHPNVASDLNSLAILYDAQGKYAEAEPFTSGHWQSWRRPWGPEHPDVATSLENYAAILRKMKHDEEAAKMEARAKAIRAKKQ